MMDTDFLEPATRAVLAMTAALLLHHSDEFSRKLQRKFRKSPNLSQQPNLLAVPRSAEQVQDAEPASDASECTVSDASSVVALGPAIVYSAPEQQSFRYDSYGAPRDFETPKRPPVIAAYHGDYDPNGSPMVVVDSPASSYSRRYIYTPPPELDDADESFQLGRRAVPHQAQILRDVGPLNTSYTASAPFIRTPNEVISRTPQKRVFQRQVTSQSPGVLSSTLQQGSVPQSRFFPSEPSPILASPRSPRTTTGSMLIRTPQGIRVMTPQEEQSYRLARLPAEQVQMRARLVRGAQVTPQSPRTSPYAMPAPAYHTPQLQPTAVTPESPESIQMARPADRYHVRSRIVRRPPTTPTSQPGPYAVPDSAKASSPFQIARPAGGYRRLRPPSLMDSTLPSFASFPMAEASRSQYYYSASSSTPVSRRGIGFPELSQLPPSPINTTLEESFITVNTPSTPQRRVPMPAGSPYARPRPNFNQSYIAPTPRSLHSPSHMRSPIRPPGWDASTARHVMTSAIRDKTASPQRKEENLENEEMEFAPDMNSTMGGLADTSTAGGQQGDDIRDALWTLYSRINRQVAIMQAGDKPAEEERVGIFRRSSADYDVEEGRMRD